TGATLAPLPLATSDDLDLALEATARGFSLWRDTAPEQRAAILTKTAALLRERTDRIATIATLEQGKPVAEAKGEIGLAAGILEFHAGE
ncbi:aldehyde dehydrogenase family protein, partial [Acinetobacter baumannii]